MKEYIVKALSKDNERKILQLVYVTMSIAMLIVAGIIGLVNSQLGHKLSLVAAVLFGAFVVNAALWAVVKTAGDNYLGDELKKARKKK
ncbi:MAG: hypothetical protein LBQ11_01390 [Candidatus Nomurabacteria bacterium]|jgi:hypothetical protein|nr:hypothetical protein [Candidatus Nomurabacteria bacterium]